MQSFIGKINFLHWFIPNFAETIKQITAMLKKDQEVKWTAEAKNSFEYIRIALMEAPVLVSPDFTKEFLTFSFASEDTLVVVLLQKNCIFQQDPQRLRAQVQHFREAILLIGKCIKVFQNLCFTFQSHCLCS